MQRFVWGIVLTVIGGLGLLNKSPSTVSVIGSLLFLGAGIPLIIVGAKAKKRQKQKFEAQQAELQQAEVAANQVKVTCSGCGASVVALKSGITKCEYCGADINGTVE